MKNILILVIFVLSAIPGSDCLAKTSYASFPVPAKGGTFVTSVHSNPRSLNPILMDTASDFELAANLFMSLIQIDSQTYQEFPGLCEKVEVSKDQKTYTYTLNKNAKWSDGTPVTSDDVEFTFKKMMDPTVYAAPLRGQFGGVTFEKIDQHKFKFLVSVPKFNTRLNLNTFVPVQKKQFENEKDFNGSKANLKPVGNGPYLLKTISRDQFVMLERDRNWWAKDLPDYRATANFDQIQFKVIQDMTLNYELFVKGGLDVSPITSEQFATQVNGSDRSQIGSNENSGKKMWAAKFPSSHPMGWFGVALNNRHPILSSVKVRQALAQLVDYEAVIQRAYFNMTEQSVSPFGSKSDNTAPELKSGVKKYKYDSKKAIQILKEDGWADTDQDGILDRMINGKKTPLKIEIKFSGGVPAISKTVQILKESFKKAGVELTLRLTDSSAFYKDFEEHQFEAAMMGWGAGSMHPEARQVWHSASYANQGSNAVGYSNPKVDQLIEQSDLEFDLKKRVKLLQEINRQLYNDVPYIFLVERNFVMQGLQSKVKSPVWIQKYSTTISKDLFHF